MAHPADTPDRTTNDFPVIEDGPRRAPFRIVAAGLTDAGLVRENNEDNFFVAGVTRSVEIRKTSLPGLSGHRISKEPGHLLIVADGMGGVVGGERASALAVETVVSCVIDDFRSFVPKCHDEEALACELRESLERADRAVIAAAEAEPRLAGMGTTVTIAYVIGGWLYVAHAGDSRPYLLRGETLTQITQDHTLVQLMVQGGLLTAEGAKTHGRRNVVTNVVGGPGEGVTSEIHKRELAVGDVVLLCSDGLSEPVDDRSIAAILAREPDAESAAKALVAAAIAAGAPDNVTVVVARVEPWV